MTRQIIQHLRTNIKDKKPTSSDILNGEIAVNYTADSETLYIKNSNDEIVEFKDKKYIDSKLSNVIQAVDTGDVLDDVDVDYATKAYVDGLVGDINSVLESIINGSETPTIITFTLRESEYQAEEGMTFYDWGMSKYYDSNIHLTVDPLTCDFRGDCEQYGNTSVRCYNRAGMPYTPDILLNSVIQPITYVPTEAQGQ